MTTPRYNLKLVKGDTEVRTFHWEDVVFQHKNISAITRAAPTQVTAASHGVPNGWRVWITDVVGMYQINAAHNPPYDSEYHRATYVDASNISINKLSSMSFDAYVSGGVLWYRKPKVLTGFTARLTIKDRVGGTILLALVSPTNIAIDTANYKITVTIDATATTAFTWTKGVYDLEMVSADVTPVVTKIAAGQVEVLTEVTT